MSVKGINKIGVSSGHAQPAKQNSDPSKEGITAKKPTFIADKTVQIYEKVTFSRPVAWGSYAMECIGEAALVPEISSVVKTGFQKLFSVTSSVTNAGFQKLFSVMSSVGNEGVQQVALYAAGSGEGAIKSTVIANHSRYQVSLSNHTKALQNAKNIPHEGARFSVFREMCDALLKSKDPLSEENFILLEKIADSFGRLNQTGAYTSVCKVLLAKGDCDKAAEMAKKIPDPNKRAVIFANICKDLLAKGELEKALSILEIFISNKLVQERICTMIGEVLSTYIPEDFTKAMDAVNGMQDALLRTRLLGKIWEIHAPKSKL